MGFGGRQFSMSFAPSYIRDRTALKSSGTASERTTNGSRENGGPEVLVSNSPKSNVLFFFAADKRARRANRTMDLDA
ncbi:hypothetical protein L249_6847 [Ophiocordyceps polyrhachis-furcata BCC 54312]|uniref:Uncharacterized protein n=1 Tax=Ophiocordyceps polyrhachis-furcata BCC 54312 TaxID=1330021 RepID=A0A367LL38_9HYPO|nr:hypothetical protein L249_6847 [Ophiocordyceps polyrhachis-furcata BCC 54312]